ncbi:MAG TPA: hypothetical protein DDZ83_08045 [Nitrospinae bacterium]|nr:hypothetical protein [Nitrospinota bacterium]
MIPKRFAVKWNWRPMVAGETILFSEMTPGPGWEDEFNAWYDSEHIPLRMAVPGFRGAQRYRRKEDSKYLAVYEMDSQEVLLTEAYRRVKEEPSALTRRMLSSVSGFSRYIANQTGVQRRADLSGDPLEAPVLYALFSQVPENCRAEFEDWYAGEHVPALLKNESWLMCRQFSVAVCEPWEVTHLGLHYLRDENALASPEREEALTSEWRTRLSGESWFEEKELVFERMGAGFHPKT